MEITQGHLLGGRVRHDQPETGFRSGIEPVLLAATIPARPGARVLEGGSGAGAGLLCLAARVPGIEGVGIEQDATLARLATTNAAANGYSGLRFQAGDVLADALPAPVTHAFANPPYHASTGTAPTNPARRIAKRAAPGELARWVIALARPLARHGTFSMSVAVAALPEVLAAFGPARLGSTRVLPLWPHAGEPARLVLCQGTKEGRGAFHLLAGLVLHEGGGGFTDAAQAVLRDGATLPMDPA